MSCRGMFNEGICGISTEGGRMRDEGFRGLSTVSRRGFAALGFAALVEMSERMKLVYFCAPFRETKLFATENPLQEIDLYRGFLFVLDSALAWPDSLKPVRAV